MIPPDEPVGYRRIADDLREQIRGGILSPGQRIMSVKGLVQEYGVARGTAERALQVLKDEGLVVTERGKRSRVAEPSKKVDQPIGRKTRISGRPATPDESREMGLRPGAQIFVVTHAGREHKFAQDRVELTVT